MLCWICLLVMGCQPLFSVEVEEEECPVLILGAGIGALTSATYLARAGIPPIVITGPDIGGTITQSHQVENWPGEISISGLELSEKVKKQAEVNGARLRAETVVSVDFSKRPYLITTKAISLDKEKLKKYKVNACIIAMGSQPNVLSIPGEKHYWAKGVYNCAVCDGGFYKDKTVAVIGGGDSALLEAQYLANIASQVHLILRRNEFRTVEKQRMREIISHPNITVHYQTIVTEVLGDQQKVTHLVVQHVEKKTKESLEVDALFLAIGSLPNTQVFKNQLELDKSGYIVLKKHQQTSLEGVYALGDVADPEFKQAVSAAGDAAKAALQAQGYIASSSSRLAKTELPVVKNEMPLLKKEVIEITSLNQFENELKGANGPILIDFYTTYCGPCRAFASIYETWAKKYGTGIKFLKVNAAHLVPLSERFQIQSVPTLIILNEKGQTVKKIAGMQEMAEVQKRLEDFQESGKLF